MGWLLTGACSWFVDYRLWNDTSYWSYGGNNPTRQGGVARRYDYYRLVGENEQGVSYGDDRRHLHHRTGEMTRPA